MEYLKQETKAGVVIVISFAILCFMLFNVTGFSAKAQTNQYTVTFTNLNGLKQNAPVMFAGVSVGKVESIDIKTGKDTHVDVGISLKKTIPLTEDSKIMISSSGFVGEKYVSITAGTSEKESLKSGAVIRGSDPTDMVKLIERFDNILNELNVEQLGKKLLAIADDAHKTVIEAKLAFSNIQTMTTQIQQSGKVQKVVNDTSDLITKFQQFADNMAGMAQENKAAIKNSITNVEELSLQLKKSVAQLKDIVNDVDNIVDENRSYIKTAVKNASDFTLVVKHEPWRLIWKEDTDQFFKDREKDKK